MNSFNVYLKRRPYLFKKYVSYGTFLAKVMTLPINMLMKHLLVVQGLDPKSQPGDLFRKELFNQFDTIDSFAYEKEYDHSWATQKFESVKKSHPDLTREQFDKITDVSQFVSPNSIKDIVDVNRERAVVKATEFLKNEYLSGEPLKYSDQEAFQTMNGSFSGPITPITVADIEAARERKLLSNDEFSPDLSTKEGRSAYRVKAVQDYNNNKVGMENKEFSEIGKFKEAVKSLAKFAEEYDVEIPLSRTMKKVVEENNLHHNPDPPTKKSLFRRVKY